ncbi:DNA polymerase I [Helicobacter pylori]|uniref:DNA polymerase I n=2 Tax=Helicobacter pylori TaxID=210 RepID=DPO1_HELPY|nr:DNA polymerase I [Helicobacter pylori]P56105.2 RecName: Full=DNA polymerase I; Short=POL I [Helicobacter pylori 26695]AFV42691.1 DNA polymerase I [Helicobacter pylori 26695]AFV44288.1 DNA polymerase I [Helicobacter pylori Rif1]AFV45878.1 DNA polymerase I [Helicobacter pylori Rif2]AJF09679.1 DNA polymerase I [Helicobacter pylori 26695-1]AJF11219.1 DNA polymerase I [Helicobacter pylori]
MEQPVIKEGTLALIDTFAYLFRSYYMSAKNKPLTNDKGFPTGLLTGLVGMVKKFYKDRKNMPFIVFALESQTKTKRAEKLGEYKQNRKDAPKEMLLQIPIALEWLQKMGFVCVEVNGFEADDVIASLATLSPYKTRIYSKDKDFNQLLSDKIALFDGKTEFLAKDCVEKYGILPSQFTDYQGIVGDSSDNYKGVKGIGSKNAKELLQRLGSLEKIYENLDLAKNLLSPKMYRALIHDKASAFLSKELATLERGCIKEFDFLSCAFPSENPLLKIKDELKEYGFISTLRDLENSPTPLILDNAPLLDNTPALDNTPKKSCMIVLESAAPLSAFLEKLEKTNARVFARLVLDKEKKVLALAFLYEDQGYFLPLEEALFSPFSLEFLQNAFFKMLQHAQIIGHDLKPLLSFLKAKYQVPLENIRIQDTQILAFLKNPEKVGFDEVLKEYLKEELIPHEKIKDFKTKAEKLELLSVELNALKRLCEYFEKGGLEENLLSLAREIETPFMKVLMGMEFQGFKIDAPYFKRLEQEFKNELHVLERQILELIGVDFNLNSPKQLSEVLYDKLGLPKNKSHSTDEKSLLKILDKHPSIALILEYRELNKLFNTYTTPLLRLKDKDDKIHTTFIQTGTATGRLSSHSPNLQNIPVRSPKGLLIRKGFIASSKEYCLLGVDYSQIELRLLAHFSQDKDLMEAFLKGRDIHLETSKALFGEYLAKEKRSIAKSINFGLVYGMGSKKLSETLNISLNEAKSYIEAYFKRFPSIKDYLNRMKEEILKTSKAFTLLGRYRVFDFTGANDYVKGNYLREGVNAIFQGSASDLLKLGMLKVSERFKNNPSVRLLLQVHDELIFEIEEKNAPELQQEIQRILNDEVYPLRVPLETSAFIAKRWNELKG